MLHPIAKQLLFYMNCFYSFFKPFTHIFITHLLLITVTKSIFINHNAKPRFLEHYIQKKKKNNIVLKG